MADSVCIKLKTHYAFGNNRFTGIYTSKRNLRERFREERDGIGGCTGVSVSTSTGFCAPKLFVQSSCISTRIDRLTHQHYFQIFPLSRNEIRLLNRRPQTRSIGNRPGSNFFDLFDHLSCGVCHVAPIQAP